MSTSYDLRAPAPAADSGPVKFPVAQYASAASYFDSYAEEIARAAKTIDRAAFDHAAGILLEAYLNGARMFSCGNGGSASDAQHLAAEVPTCRGDGWTKC